MADLISGKDKMLDAFSDAFFQDLTAIGVNFIHENTPKAVEAVKKMGNDIAGAIKEIFVTIKNTGKPEQKVDSIIRDLCNKSLAEGCEIGYQEGRQQKMQMMLYGMSQAGLHMDQIKQIFAATKKAEDEFADSYDTYEHYLLTMDQIEKGR